jgi:3-hydroxybutyrate dehydrogenase
VSLCFFVVRKYYIDDENRTVGTPLFTEHPEAAKFLDMDQDYLLPPKEIALAMMSLLTDPKYKSGTILEVCEVGRWREVALLNDPGPSGPASKTSKKHEALKDILPFLNLEEGMVIRTD